MAEQQQQKPLLAYNDGYDGNNAECLSTSSLLSLQPSVARFNTVVEARQGRRYKSHLEVMAMVLNRVGQEVQDVDGKRYILPNVNILRGSTVLVSVGDATMTAEQLMATPHLAALFHLGVQRTPTGTYTMVSVESTDFSAVKQIFEAVAAERMTLSFCACHDRL